MNSAINYLNLLCSLLEIVDMCLDEDLETFKANVQDVVDELEEMRRECSNSIQKAHVTRLMFIITRCSRLVLTGMGILEQVPFQHTLQGQHELVLEAILLLECVFLASRGSERFGQPCILHDTAKEQTGQACPAAH